MKKIKPNSLESVIFFTLYICGQDNLVAEEELEQLSIEIPMLQKLYLDIYGEYMNEDFEGERAVAKAASSAGTMFGVSSLATVTVEDIAKISTGPKMFQFYFHKDRGLNDALLERAKAAKFNVLALTVDTITGGNRERDLRTGFTSPPKLTLDSILSFAFHPMWAWNFFTKEKFDMPHLSGHVTEGTNLAVSVGQYFSTMLDQSMNWSDAEKLCQQWNGQFAQIGRAHV